VTTLKEFRAQYPEYDDMSDADLASSMHAKFYSDMPRADFDRQIGLKRAEMRAYEPSLKDRVATFLMGDEKASPQRERAVELMMGSRGLGRTGIGAVDVIPPTAAVFGGHEAQRQADMGNYGQAALELASVIPAAGPAAKTVKGAIDTSRLGVAESAQRIGVDLPRAALNEGLPTKAVNLASRLAPMPVDNAVAPAAARSVDQLKDAFKTAISKADDVRVDRIHQMGSQVDDVFDMRTFATAYNGMSVAERTKAFGKPLKSALDDIVNVTSRSDRLFDLSKQTQVGSGVMGSGTWGSAIALLHGHFQVPMAQLGNYGIQKILARPATAQPMARLLRAMKNSELRKSPLTQAAVEAAARELAKALKEEAER
jgi:hypothetical protein